MTKIPGGATFSEYNNIHVASVPVDLVVWQTRRLCGHYTDSSIFVPVCTDFSSQSGFMRFTSLEHLEPNMDSNKFCFVCETKTMFRAEHSMHFTPTTLWNTHSCNTVRSGIRGGQWRNSFFPILCDGWVVWPMVSFHAAWRWREKVQVRAQKDQTRRLGIEKWPKEGTVSEECF